MHTPVSRMNSVRFRRRNSRSKVADLRNLRGLEGDAPQGDPVGRAVLGLPSQKGNPQQPNGQRRHNPAVLLHPGEIPQEQPQHQEQHQPQEDGDKLLQKAPGGAGGRHRQREGGEEKGDSLHLKAHAPGAPEDGGIQPHDPHQPQEGQGNRRGGPCDAQLQAGQDLEHG